MNEEVMREVIIAVCVAMSEQLDADRLLVALKRQHDAYASGDGAGAQAVAAALRQIGGAVHDIQQLREKRGGPQH